MKIMCVPSYLSPIFSPPVPPRTFRHLTLCVLHSSDPNHGHSFSHLGFFSLVLQRSRISLASFVTLPAHLIGVFSFSFGSSDFVDLFLFFFASAPSSPSAPRKRPSSCTSESSDWCSCSECTTLEVRSPPTFSSSTIALTDASGLFDVGGQGFHVARPASSSEFQRRGSFAATGTPTRSCQFHLDSSTLSSPRLSDRPNARGRARSDSGNFLFTSGQCENVELIALARVCWFLHLVYFCTSSASNTQRTPCLGTREFIGSRRSPSISNDFTESIQHLQSHAGCGRVRRLSATTRRMRHVLPVPRTWIGNNTQSSKFIFSHWLFFALFRLIDDPDAVSAFFCVVPYLATPPTLSLIPPSHSALPEFQLGVCLPLLPSAFHHFAFGTC